MMRRNGPLARVKERLESVPRFGTIIVMRDQHLDPQWKIIRLEERVEELAARVENCRKFILVARLAVGGGGIVLVAMLVGVIQFDLGLMAAAVASTLGGFVVWGSNSSTARETSKEIVKLESERAALIEYINSRVIYSAAPRV
jgi:hypothetical protein